MALAPIVATALTTPGAHAWSLWIDGLDVIRKPGTAGSGYGTPIESVEVTEAGPGRVSSMTFTIEDPALEVGVQSGAYVVLWNHTDDIPQFAGYLMTPSFRPWGVGRAIQCRAIGREAALDWAVLPAFTPPPSTFLGAAIQAAVAAASFPPGVGGLNVASGPTSSQSTPIGNTSLPPTPLPVVGPGTLRQVIQAMIDRGQTFYLTNPGTIVLFTIDAYGGLRVYPRRPATPTDVPSDYGTLTVTDTTGGAVASSDLHHTLDSAATIRGVLVVGGNAAGSGVVMDGTGKAGRMTVLTDATILTADDMNGRAWAVMGPTAVEPRGDFDLEDYAIAANIHAGSPLVLTDVQTGASGTYTIGELVRRFNDSNRQQIRLTYGNPAPSFVDRATLR